VEVGLGGVTSLSAPVQDVVWQAWGEGESLRRIADRAGLQEHQVCRYLLRHGGVRPVSLSRSARHLSLLEREEISRGLAVGPSARAIAEGLRRSASTVSREIAPQRRPLWLPGDARRRARRR
jgi:DNA-binding CsgD family transcriptional regulator